VLPLYLSRKHGRVLCMNACTNTHQTRNNAIAARVLWCWYRCHRGACQGHPVQRQSTYLVRSVLLVDRTLLTIQRANQPTAIPNPARYRQPSRQGRSDRFATARGDHGHPVRRGAEPSLVGGGRLERRLAACPGARSSTNSSQAWCHSSSRRPTSVFAMLA